MTPSHAEVARTLLRGRLPGTLWVGDEPGCVHHATDPAGRPLLLPRQPDLVWPAGAPVVLAVDDVPPVAGAPSLGRAQVSGTLRRLAPAEAVAAAYEFAEANPVAGLLDVGQGAALYAMDVEGVRLERAGATHPVDLTGYTAAEPDPLHELERELLADLADHHAPQVESYFRFLLAVAGVPCCQGAPRPVRLDRYGFVVDVGGQRSWARLGFHRPVHCRHELARLLHPVLFGAHGHRHHA